MSTLTGKVFGISVRWMRVWAKSYVQVEYANTYIYVVLKLEHIFPNAYRRNIDSIYPSVCRWI